MWLIITFKQGGQIHEKVAPKGKNPITSVPLSKNAVTTILHISKLLPLILLKSIGYLLWSCFLFFPFLLLSCYISISFSTIKGIQISVLPSLSMLLHKIIIPLLWTDSSYFSFNLLSLPMASNPYYIQKTFALFCSFKLPGKAFFLMMHLALPFHFIILIHCIFLYYSLLYFDSKLALLMDETDAGQCWTC